MHPIFTENKNQLEQICKTHYVKKLYVFGSVCTNKFNEKSDIDFLVEFKPLDFAAYAENYFRFCDELEKLFQRKVDVITEKSLSNPYFINQVNKTKTAVYA